MESASGMIGRNAELQRLLASLQGQTENTQAPQGRSEQYHHYDGFSNGNAVATATNGLGNFSHSEAVGQVQLKPESVKTKDPRSRPQKPLTFQSDTDNTRPSTPVLTLSPDASMITTWPAAVKHVTKHIVPNEQLASRIKHLIQEQHKHELQWFRQREDIVAQQKLRVGGSQAYVSGILQGLGGLAIPIAKVDQAADKNELEVFDKKVYGALAQLVKDYDAQLRKLGVPFYAIKHDLVVDERVIGGAATSYNLDKGELKEMQKKMLQILEDLLIDG